MASTVQVKRRRVALMPVLKSDHSPQRRRLSTGSFETNKHSGSFEKIGKRISNSTDEVPVGPTLTTSRYVRCDRCPDTIFLTRKALDLHRCVLTDWKKKMIRSVDDIEKNSDGEVLSVTLVNSTVIRTTAVETVFYGQDDDEKAVYYSRLLPRIHGKEYLCRSCLVLSSRRHNARKHAKNSHTCRLPLSKLLISCPACEKKIYHTNRTTHMKRVHPSYAGSETFIVEKDKPVETEEDQKDAKSEDFLYYLFNSDKHPELSESDEECEAEEILAEGEEEVTIKTLVKDPVLKGYLSSDTIMSIKANSAKSLSGAIDVFDFPP